MYNIAVLGAPGTGKKTFVNRFASIIGDGLYAANLNTNYGEFNFRIHVGTKIDLKTNIDAVIILFDASDIKSILYVYDLDLPIIPIILCANKIDLEFKLIPEKTNGLLHNLSKTNCNVSCNFISAKTGSDVKFPLLRLLRMFELNNDIIFVEKSNTKKIEIPEKLYEKMKRIYTSDKLNLTIEELINFHSEMKSLF